MLKACSSSKKFCWPLQAFSSDAAIPQQIFGRLRLELFSESIFKSQPKQFLKYHLNIRLVEGEAIFLNCLSDFYYPGGLMVVLSSFPN